MSFFLKKIAVFFRLINDKQVDWSGRCETPVGAAGQVRPRRSDSEATEKVSLNKKFNFPKNHFPKNLVFLYLKWGRKLIFKSV